VTPSDGIRWIKSSYSDQNDNCVEVARRPDGSVLVRDSKAGDRSPILSFSTGEWRAFLAGARNGEFD
jgi:hypothetical protein